MTIREEEKEMAQRTPITQKALDSLDEYELAVFEWQYHLKGHFYDALWEAICRADTGNLDLLYKAFPVEVEGFRLYAYKLGWWPAVEKKVFEANV